MKKSVEISTLIADVREHLLYAKELGVELLDVDLEPSSKTAGVESVAGLNEPDGSATIESIPRELPDLPLPLPTSETKSTKRKPSRLASLPSLSNRTHVTNGNSTPTPSKTHDVNSANQIGDKTGDLAPPKAESLADALFDAGPELPQTGETINDIREDIGDCTRCPLYLGRTQVVHSTGNLQADLMFVGEAPGADEDAQGFPFVGRAGQLLTKIIESIGIKREDVFIGNINRCRPPGNRQPTLPEAHTCRPFLLREIAVVRPKVIVVMGNTAMHNLLDTKVGITKMRGHFQDYFGVKVMPTFHPAFLLRDPHKKREVWEDMKKVRDYLKGK
jgi:uracil-DNA glycosylase